MTNVSEITVTIKLDTDGTYLAYNDEVHTHGIGATPDEAVQDYLDALEDLFFELQEDEMFLADHLARELDYLRGIFVVDSPT